MLPDIHMKYKYNFRYLTFKYMLGIIEDIREGKEWREMPEEDQVFIEKIAFMESISEASLQLILSCLLLRSYGIGSDTYSLIVQILSFCSSILTMVISFGSVS